MDQTRARELQEKLALEPLLCCRWPEAEQKLRL